VEAIPLVLAGPESCRHYFQELERFLMDCLGDGVRNRYRIIVGAPDEVGRMVRAATDGVHALRRSAGQAYYFNWELQIPVDLQESFIPTHEAMAALDLDINLPKHKLASNLRCVFSGLVSGNIKSFGIEQVRLHGPYKLSGDGKFLASMDRLLQMLIREKRMKLVAVAEDYQPCYQLAD
tara:strand:- start:74506 stop:75042 length:537 start_codon:yes stop_codon:yes gene_type:complete